MRFFIPFFVAALLVIACFLPWLTFRGATLTGVDSANFPFGKPAYFHFATVGGFALFYSINVVWTRIVAFALTAFNLIWAIKNYLSLPACSSGNAACPEREIGLNLVLILSILLFFAALLAPAKQARAKKTV